MLILKLIRQESSQELHIFGNKLQCLNLVKNLINMRYNSVAFLLPDLSAGGAERVTITIARLLRKKGLSKANKFKAL